MFVKGRTVIMITHKLKTVAGADKIILLDRGKITEQGTHSELMEKNGLYARMWNIQQESNGWQIEK